MTIQRAESFIPFLLNKIRRNQINREKKNKPKDEIFKGVAKNVIKILPNIKKEKKITKRKREKMSVTR